MSKISPLATHLKNHNIILASQSPRRKELLAGLDIPFTTQPLHTDESYPPDLKAQQITEFLCKKKAAVYTNWRENDLLITADTIVWHNDKALEKPKDETDAIRMIEQLSGKTHQVITSVGIFTLKKEVIISDITQVTFSDLTQKEIEYYVQKHQPLDKAGAYGIQEWIGFVGVQSITGSYFNVVGLPVEKLYATLKKF